MFAPMYPNDVDAPFTPRFVSQVDLFNCPYSMPTPFRSQSMPYRYRGLDPFTLRDLPTNFFGQAFGKSQSVNLEVLHAVKVTSVWEKQCLLNHLREEVVERRLVTGQLCLQHRPNLDTNVQRGLANYASCRCVCNGETQDVRVLSAHHYSTFLLRTCWTCYVGDARECNSEAFELRDKYLLGCHNRYKGHKQLRSKADVFVNFT
jgi:hypothetical protein